jgi:hypothetical protein
MNRRIFILTCISVYLVVALLTGCASTKQMVPAASGPIPANSARIIVLREGGFAGSAAPIGIIDSGKQIGEVGLHSQLVWDRIAGPMQLVGFHADAPDHRTPPIQMCVGAGMTYRFMASWPALNIHNYPKIELLSGTPVLCEENNANANSGKFQQPSVTAATSAASAAAQPIKSNTPELSGTFTGDVKIIEVKHFTQSEGLSLSQEFINSFYDGLRERLIKEQVANQIVDEGSAVPDDVAANTVIIEGKFTEYKQGGFLVVGAVSSEIKLYRKSDHALFATITPKVPYKPSPLNTDKIIGKATGGRTVYEIKKALKK